MQEYIHGHESLSYLHPFGLLQLRGGTQGPLCNVMREPVAATVFASIFIFATYQNPGKQRAATRKLLLNFQNKSFSWWGCKERPRSEMVTYLPIRNRRRLFLEPLPFWKSWLKLANGFRSYWRRGNL